MHATAAAILWTALALSGPPNHTESASADVAVIPLSQVFLIHDLPVAAEETGLLDSVNVEQGDRVTEKQILAQIDDRQVQLEKQAAEREKEAAIARAKDDIDIQFARKSLELAEAELRDALRINERSPGTVPLSEVRRLQLEKDRAQLQIRKSQLEMRVARLKAEVHQAAVDAANEKIRRRKLRATFDGLVLEVLHRRGEWVSAGQPVLRVVRMDRLWVDGLISAAEYDPQEINGRPVTIEVELARGRVARLSGRVVFVNPLVQAGNRYRVRAEIENRREGGQWLLQAGKFVRTLIHLKGVKAR